MDIKVSLASHGITRALQPPRLGNVSLSDLHKYGALHIIRYCIDSDLNSEYPIDESLSNLWQALKARCGHQKEVTPIMQVTDGQIFDFSISSNPFSLQYACTRR